jgi:hypothetical protein
VRASRPPISLDQSGSKWYKTRILNEPPFEAAFSFSISFHHPRITLRQRWPRGAVAPAAKIAQSSARNRGT